MDHCKNCETPFNGNFCPNCGQKKNEGRIVLKESAKDVLENYFDFDAPLFKTIKNLSINPGKLIKDYIKGKRKSFSHPFKYYITALAISLIISGLIDFDPVAVFNKAAGITESLDSNTPSVKAGDYMRAHINFFLLIFAFTLAFFTKLFNRKSEFNFTEYIAMSFYIAAHYVFLSAFPVLLSQISPKFFLINFIIVLVYPIWVITSMHKGNIFMRLIKGVTVSLLAWVSYVAIALIIALQIVSVFGL